MNDNPSTITSGADVTPEEGEDASQSPEEGEELLKQINEATGRNYQTLEEAQKGIKETYSFIGQLGQLKEKARAYDELQAQKKVKPEDKTQEYYQRVEKMEFLYNYPEAKSVVDEVADIAQRRGTSMTEAYENSPLKKFIEKEKKEQEAAQPSFVASGQRLTPGQMGMSREDFNQLSLEEQRKIISKLPGWSEKIPKGRLESSKRTG